MKIEEMVDVFLILANFAPHAFLTLVPPNGNALNLKALIKVSTSKSPGLLVLIKFKGLRGLPYNEAAAGGWRNCDVRLWRQDGALCVNVRLFWVCMQVYCKLHIVHSIGSVEFQYGS